MTKLSFDNWMKKVNDIVYKKIKLNLSDLPDEDFWVVWNKDKSPQFMANIVLKDYGDFMEFVYNF
tara:strand:- start:104 stop:298 length:195 start_codon:yes stop_codon:yes gene_type:complete